MTKTIKKQKKLTVAEYNAQIDKDTRKFNKLDKAGKRVMIAQDVIVQLNLEILVAKEGAYVDLSRKLKYNYESEDIKANYSKIKQCPVCALGACLMSVTRLNNKLKFSDVNAGLDKMNHEKISSLFKDVFTPKQLLLIETAFEGTNNGDKYAKDVMDADLDDDKLDEANDFHYKYKYFGDDTLLKEIMLNIIKNKGTFKP